LQVPVTASFLKNISGFLFDLDGVVYIGDSVIDGARETIASIKAKGLPCRFATNTTTRCLDSLYEKVAGLGLPIEKQEIISPPRIAASYLRRFGRPRCWLIMDEDTKKDFAEFPQSDDRPDFIVIGNYGDKWNYQLLNRLFQKLLGGAELVALHKGKYWQTSAGLTLDIGCFVAGLEYVTGKAATVIGKPEKAFFQAALDDMHLPADRVAMVGDDIDSDIGGAQRACMKGILVKTGKYREELVARSPVQPDMVIDSIAALPEYL
jgi:HAD superfamily hydrolase (TIGR01458 family)